MEVPLFHALVLEEPRTQQHKMLSQKTEVLGAAYSDFVVLSCTVFIGLQGDTESRPVDN